MTSYVIGQLSDPNIHVLTKYFDGFIDLASDMHWDLQSNKLYVDGMWIKNISSAFIRSNVFEEQTNQKYANYYLLKNYIEVNKDIKFYNRGCKRETPYKLYDLMVAKKVGLNVPHTEATKYATKKSETIIKPITGGAHAVIGKEATYSGILQQRIIGQNKRLYIINNIPFCFEVVSNMIDYREDNNTYVKISDIPQDQIDKVKELTKQLNLNFSATDFMVDKNKKHWYLETNTLPMFAAFDLKVNGMLAKTIAEELEKI